MREADRMVDVGGFAGVERDRPGLTAGLYSGFTPRHEEECRSSFDELVHGCTLRFAAASYRPVIQVFVVVPPSSTTRHYLLDPPHPIRKPSPSFQGSLQPAASTLD